MGSPLASIPGPESELSRLTAAMFDGSITVPDRDRLVAILRDPASRRSYRRMVWLHANLMRLWSDGVAGMAWAPQPVPVPAEPAGASSSPSHGLFALVALLVAPWERLRNHASRAAVVAVVGVFGATVVCLALLAGTGFFRTRELVAPVRPPRVEVVSGLHTDAGVADAIFELAKAWGKVPVHARSTPGFIVNRIARPFYAESLALLQEQAAQPEQLDALLRGAGFRMGPCELMDLIGHDTNFSVTQSVFEANFFDRRFTPSLVQREMVDGGWLGRKSGRGFYNYPDGAPALAATNVSNLPATGQWVVHGSGDVADALAVAVSHHLGGKAASRATSSNWVGLEVAGLQLRQTDGRPAWQVAQDACLKDVAVFDELPTVSGGVLAFACVGRQDASELAAAALHALGYVPAQVSDTPGLVVARTLAMLVNEAADAVLQGVCTPEGANAAMKLGVNYPAGPFDWLDRMGRARVVAVLHALDACYRGERYRVSPWLQRAV